MHGHCVDISSKVFSQKEVQLLFTCIQIALSFRKENFGTRLLCPEQKSLYQYMIIAKTSHITESSMQLIHKNMLRWWAR